jgi:hypothetical protein
MTLRIGEAAREELDVPECMRLLGTATLGRLGYTQAALPAIQPVTYAMADGAVVMPAVPGSPAVAAVHGAIVVLTVDSFAASPSDGWVVTVVGPTRVCGGSVLLEPGLVSGWRATFDGEP